MLPSMCSPWISTSRTPCWVGTFSRPSTSKAPPARTSGSFLFPFLFNLFFLYLILLISTRLHSIPCMPFCMPSSTPHGKQSAVSALEPVSVTNSEWICASALEPVSVTNSEWISAKQSLSIMERNDSTSTWAICLESEVSSLALRSLKIKTQ